jgi:hypothetical protein
MHRSLLADAAESRSSSKQQRYGIMAAEINCREPGDSKPLMQHLLRVGLGFVQKPVKPVSDRRASTTPQFFISDYIQSVHQDCVSK